MLFNDNPTSIVVPFKDMSLFFKFFTLRNTDKPSSKGVEAMEFSVVNDGEIIFSNNYPLKNLNFINYNFLLPSDDNIKIAIPKVDGFGKIIAKIISFQIEITPDIFLALECFDNLVVLNTYDIGKLISSTIIHENSNESCIVEQKNLAITNVFIKSIKEYNKYLYIRLVKSNLWKDFANERNIDEDWIIKNLSAIQISTSIKDNLTRAQKGKTVMKILAIAKIINDREKGGKQ
jgi:hypothetical protein